MRRTRRRALTVGSGATAAAVAVAIAVTQFAPKVDQVVPAPDLQALVAAGYVTITENAVSYETAVITATLEQLPEDTTEETTGQYDRDYFGQRWADIDRNGCDTRNDELAAWMSSVTFKPQTNDCVVLHGVLDDPYTGLTISFTRGQGTSEAVQIDHLWPLAAAWQRGADRWSDQKRLEFANDPLNLTPVDGPTNQSKSDSGPEWFPPNRGYRCTYAARLVLVAATYGIELTSVDRATLHSALTDCG
ncbi:HNH endonuclease family protein [Microbacterium flavum]|uniref:HNH endonuclease family protein n=1 Tax=Microbacterium flavum TaxID=415216 RepID=UPI0024AD63B6|nr:HNH endonuclease family protein [Microbacterium flavum]